MAETQNSSLKLEPTKLVRTIKELEKRILADFGERGLTWVCRELCSAAEKARERGIRLRRPNWPLRAVPFAATALVVYLTVMISSSIAIVDAKIDKVIQQDIRDLLKALQNLMNHAALPIALAIPLPFVLATFAFIGNLEGRWKRKRALRYLHELRSIIHVIDMHQLPKDPHGVPDGTDPDFISGERLIKYLDYCSELLSMSAKVAALYAESSRDAVVIATVSDLGQITSNLSSAIWQKINIVERNMAAAARCAA